VPWRRRPSTGPYTALRDIAAVWQRAASPRAEPRSVPLHVRRPPGPRGLKASAATSSTSSNSPRSPPCPQLSSQPPDDAVAVQARLRQAGSSRTDINTGEAAPGPVVALPPFLLHPCDIPVHWHRAPDRTSLCLHRNRALSATLPPPAPAGHISPPSKPQNEIVVSPSSLPTTSPVNSGDELAGFWSSPPAMAPEDYIASILVFPGSFP
jgi:hypothetical protein